jgi:hypothetical protein
MSLSGSGTTATATITTTALVTGTVTASYTGVPNTFTASSGTIGSATHIWTWTARGRIPF